MNHPQVRNSDSRRYVRYELLDYAMAVTQEHPEGIRIVVADVGLGGLALRSKSQLTSGEHIKICLNKGDGTQITFNAGVRYSDRVPETGLYASGVQFTPESHEERLDIAMFVNEAFLKLCDTNVLV